MFSPSPHIPATSTTQSLGNIGFRFDKQTHPNCMALYVVRVPQAGDLPTASFRFHLAMDTLAVQLMVAIAKLLPMSGALDTHGQARGTLKQFKLRLT